MKAHEPTEEAAQPNCRRRRSPVPKAALRASSGSRFSGVGAASTRPSISAWRAAMQASRVARHRLEPTHQQVECELEALVGVAGGEVVGEAHERRELVRRQ